MPGDFDGLASTASSVRAPGAAPRRPWGWLAALAATVLLAAVLALARAGVGAAAWLFAALALLVTALLAAAVGYQWARSRHAEPLREARSALLALQQVQDTWQWQTDREHRLVRLQPPHGAPASNWVDGAAVGQPLWERFHEPSGALRQRLLAQAPLPPTRVQRGGIDGQREWTLRGQPRLDGQGRFAGYLGLAQPTEAEDARLRDHAMLQALWAGSPLGLARLVQAEAGQPWLLLQANPVAAQALGLPATLKLPLAWPEAMTHAPAALRELLESAEPLDGERTDAWEVSVHRLDAPGAERLVALTPAGVDEQQQALAAEHAAFSYTVSHDLRAPIRVVEGFARILQEDYGRQLDRIGRDHLDRVLAAASRMNQMIDALLSLSKLSTQPLARQPVNLTQMATWVVDDLRRAQPERPVRVSIQDGLMAHGDPTLMRMALENLLGNAWKYSGKVASPEIAFERVVHQGREVFVVRDNGAGFDMRFADRLFGVFQRLHGANDFPGSGVGLASVRRIVRRHGGEIWAESEVGQGARFYFTLGG